MDLKIIKDKLAWAKENLSYARPLDNLEIEDVEWLIHQAEILKQIANSYKDTENDSMLDFGDFYNDVEFILYDNNVIEKKE